MVDAKDRPDSSRKYLACASATRKSNHTTHSRSSTLTQRGPIPDNQSLLFSSLGRIGIVTNGFDSPYYGQMVESACNYLSTRGFHSVVQSNLHSHSGELNAWSSLSDMQCDGLIIHTDSSGDDELNALMHRQPTAVLLNRYLSAYPTRCVFVDNEKGGLIAANCLLDYGHKHIAMVKGPAKFKEVHERTTGFTKGLEQGNAELSLSIEGDFHQPSGEKAMEYILNATKKITAVFFHNDEMAFGALNTCRRLGIRVPEDISVIGYDGMSMCDYVSPRLSSVQQPLRQIAAHAAQLVCDLVEGKSTTGSALNNVYSTVLAERDSIAPPAGQGDKQYSLTTREKECLSWTARGKTSWEISVILSISESTATFHLRNAAIKLKASNRTHAVAKALSSGLIHVPC